MNRFIPTAMMAFTIAVLALSNCEKTYYWKKALRIADMNLDTAHKWKQIAEGFEKDNDRLQKSLINLSDLYVELEKHPKTQWDVKSSTTLRNEPAFEVNPKLGYGPVIKQREDGNWDIEQ